MLNPNRITYAVELQRRRYGLLKWMTGAVRENIINFNTAHTYSSLPEAAEKWIVEHYENIPPSARPQRDDLAEFYAFFSTYLENSFVLVRDAGKQLYSPDAHCFCPICSWLIESPNFKTKKPNATDKRRARKMRMAAVKGMAASLNVILNEKEVAAIVDDSSQRKTTSLIAYADDLLKRINGIAAGPAVLVLWRGFAWTSEGSPKKRFQLSAKMILETEKQLRETVLIAAS